MFSKRRNNFIACFMSLLMCLSFILPCITSAKTSLTERDINVNELGMMSYEEKVEQILEPFDSYGGEVDEERLQFESTMEIVKTENNLQFLTNVQTGQVVLKEFNTILDTDKEVFYITTNYIVDDEVIYTEEIETVPYYDEETDDYFIEMPDGEIVSVKEIVNNEENMQECLAMEAAMVGTAGTAAVAVLAATLLLATVVVLQPQIDVDVTYVTKKVVSWVKSFFRWFRSILKAVVRTITTAVITKTISYSITYDYKTYKLKPFTKELAKAVSGYYLALADTDDGLLYVCPIPLTMEKALPFLIASEAITIGSAHKGSNKSFVLSLYTSTALMACTIAVEAGTLLGNPGAILHTASKTGYFDHYHPGGLYIRENNPHVFYGLPRV